MKFGLIYHQPCYCTYTSKENLSHIHLSELPPADKDAVPTTSNSMTHGSSVQATILPTMCIFCGFQSHKKDKKLRQIEYDTTEAFIRNESSEISITRFYYSRWKCITLHVILHIFPLCVRLGKNWVSIYSQIQESHCRHWCRYLCQEKGIPLSQLLVKSKGHPSSTEQTYSAYNLHKQLGNHYKDRIQIISQYGQGQSNLVTSSGITWKDVIKGISIWKDAIKGIFNLKEELKLGSVTPSLSGEDVPSEQSILHSALLILRKHIS